MADRYLDLGVTPTDHITPGNVVKKLKDNGDGTYAEVVDAVIQAGAIEIGVVDQGASGEDPWEVAVDDGDFATFGAKADAAWDGSTGSPTFMAIAKAIYAKLAGTLGFATNAGTTNATTLRVITASDGPLNTNLGTTTDAAVSTDADGSVSAKLRGLIVLVVNLLSRWPAALGTGGGLKVDGSGTALPVSGTLTANVGTEKTYTAPVSGELAGATGATQMPNVACSYVRFKAQRGNAGSVYIGISGVTKADGTTDTTTGLQLNAGEDTGWIPVDNVNRFYRICDNAADALTYLVLA